MQKKPYFACLLAHPLHFLASLNSKSTSKFSSNVLFTMLGIQNCHLYPKPTRHTSTAVSPLFFMHTFVVIFTKQIQCKPFKIKFRWEELKVISRYLQNMHNKKFKFSRSF